MVILRSVNFCSVCESISSAFSSMSVRVYSSLKRGAGRSSSRWRGLPEEERYLSCYLII